MENGFPASLALKKPEWLRANNQASLSVREYYRAQGLLLDRESGESDPDGAFPADRPKKEPEFANPVLTAPRCDPAGGVVYFSAQSDQNLITLFEVMEVNLRLDNFVAIASSSADPVNTCYLDQLWLIWNATLRDAFGVATDQIPDRQTASVEGALLGFVRAQIDKWIEPGRNYSSLLDGAAGGDGEYARESLGFGFHVASSFGGVYRIWSRAWLTLK